MDRYRHAYVLESHVLLHSEQTRQSAGFLMVLETFDPTMTIQYKTVWQLRILSILTSINLIN